MPKFEIEVVRMLRQYESTTVTVDAKNAAEAKKMVKAMDLSDHDWDQGECDYAGYEYDVLDKVN